MAREDHLRPIKLTHEQAVENGRKGGYASGEAKKRKREARELAAAILEMQIKTGKVCSVDQVRNFAALKGKNISVKEAMLVKQAMKALNGDRGALELLLDLAGELPDKKITAEVTTTQREPLSKLSMDEIKDIINDAD